MSAPRPIEEEYLASAEAALTRAVGGGHGPDSFELRIQILEATSARFGGFDLSAFHEAFHVEGKKSTVELLELALPIANAIEHSPIHHSLALSVLAREVLDEQDRKNTGAYHTDFRLATRLAQLAAPNLTHLSKVVDPACGAGILLAALTHAVCSVDRAKSAHWLAHGVCAADLSANSLRATLLSLASFTDDVAVLKTMRARWYCGDSLMADAQVWRDMTPDRFDAVIGNPPWEKVKLSKHEFLKAAGAQRHYGAKILGLNEEQFTLQRDEIASYSRRLFARYPDLGNGEPDLYIAFTALFLELCREKGSVVALVPGGLIRSQGTQAMRQKIFNASQGISFSIIDNRAKFFAIDTRFKFLAVALRKAGPKTSQPEPIRLLHERGTRTGLETTSSTTIDRDTLAMVRYDLSLPEVRNLAEWTLFSKMAETGVSWQDAGSGWTPKFCREVDMTNERAKFLTNESSGALPIVEGRMVQAHRFGVKGHVSGTGRSAVWQTFPIGGSRLAPQFWINAIDIPRSSQGRANSVRAGFCDIAGQTNERSLMASIIPAGVICGNKVPTILFPEDPSEDRLFVWVSIANSFGFDWMLRRVLTTTANYFLLQSLPMPKVTKDGLPWKRLVTLARELQSIDSGGGTREAMHRMAQLRAEIDAEVAVAYGLDLSDMELILRDFPILDRGQKALPGEDKCTITKDSVLAAMVKRTGIGSSCWRTRTIEARALGAIAYVPSELALGSEGTQKKGVKTYG